MQVRGRVPSAGRPAIPTLLLPRMWVLPAGTPFPEPAVPKGYSLRRLQEGDAALVNDRWPYGSDNTLARIRQTITALPSSASPHHFPQRCVLRPRDRAARSSRGRD